MTVVISRDTCLSTTFHTFDTHGHVVSTVVTPRASKCCISSKVAPNAGKMTTSPGLTLSKRLPPSAVFSINSMPESSSILFTPGLCSSSFVMCIFLSANRAAAASASSMERSAPQHMPYSFASRKVTAALPWPLVVSNDWARMSSSSADFISASILASTAAFSATKSELDRKNVSDFMMRRRSCFLFSTGVCTSFVPGFGDMLRPAADATSANAQTARTMLLAKVLSLYACV
mmetsp:Transcript_20485/g.72910  ORF Transcript_20485/g.72910 Transcript_20485/m.72910 type:complete len:232 (+) Transcript_20485:822-1517(+)